MISRHIPLIALTVIFAISMYYVYSNLTSMSHRLENLSQELYYGMNSVTEIIAKLDEGKSSPSQHDNFRPSEQSPKHFQRIHQPVDLKDLRENLDDAKSVASADIIITSGSGSILNDLQRKTDNRMIQDDKTPYNRPVISEIDAHDSAEDINSYIGNLEDKFVNGNNHDDDAASIGSQISSVNALSNKKKVPPFAANKFKIGWLQKYNGHLFEVIKTKGERSAVRWGRAQPIPPDWKGNPEEVSDAETTTDP